MRVETFSCSFSKAYISHWALCDSAKAYWENPGPPIHWQCPTQAFDLLPLVFNLSLSVHACMHTYVHASALKYIKEHSPTWEDKWVLASISFATTHKCTHAHTISVCFLFPHSLQLVVHKTRSCFRWNVLLSLLNGFLEWTVHMGIGHLSLNAI